MSEERRESRSYYGIALAIPCVLVFYVLSLGPVVAVYNTSSLRHHKPTGKALAAFYAPLIYVAERHSWAAEALVWYLDLFRYRTP
jgi:hypothetical protein